MVKKFDLLHETVVGFDAEWTRKAMVCVFALAIESSLDHSTHIPKCEHYYSGTSSGRITSSFFERHNEGRKVDRIFKILQVRILKSGIGIHEDCNKLCSYLGVDEVNSIVDVAYFPHSLLHYCSDIAKLMGHNDLKTSLQYLTSKYFGITLNKGTSTSTH